MALLKEEIKEIVDKGIIDWETGLKIKEHFENKPENDFNKILVFFSILGALLVGLGIILIFAHNWDSLSRTIKTGIAFLPLLTSQALAAYTKLKKNHSKSWVELSSVLLLLSIGAAIALIGQIYQLPGDTRSFLLAWIVLGLPIVYLMPSSAVSILLLLGLTSVGGEHRLHSAAVGNYVSIEVLGLYTILVLYYLYLIKRAPRSLFTLWHHFIVPIVGLLLLLRSGFGFQQLNAIIYLLALGLIFNIGSLAFFRSNRLRENPYRILGTLGTVIILFVFSFHAIWEHWSSRSATSISFTNNYILFLLLLGWIGTLIYLYRKRDFEFNPIQLTPLLFIPMPFSGSLATAMGMGISNVLLIVIGLYYFWKGQKTGRLTTLNFGMVILAALIVIRFFEMDLSFISRGLCFVVIGLAFFAANYLLIKNSKKSTQ